MRCSSRGTWSVGWKAVSISLITSFGPWLGAHRNFPVKGRTTNLTRVIPGLLSLTGISKELNPVYASREGRTITERRGSVIISLKERRYGNLLWYIRKRQQFVELGLICSSYPEWTFKLRWIRGNLVSGHGCVAVLVWTTTEGNVSDTLFSPWPIPSGLSTVPFWPAALQDIGLFYKPSPQPSQNKQWHRFCCQCWKGNLEPQFWLVLLRLTTGIAGWSLRGESGYVISSIVWFSKQKKTKCSGMLPRQESIVPLLESSGKSYHNMTCYHVSYGGKKKRL